MNKTISKQALSFCVITSLSSSVIANTNQDQTFKLIPNYGNNPNIAHVVAYKTQEKIRNFFGVESAPHIVSHANPHRYAEKSSADLSEILKYNQNVTQNIAQAIGSAQPVDFSNINTNPISVEAQTIPQNIVNPVSTSTAVTPETQTTNLLAPTAQAVTQMSVDKAQTTTQTFSEQVTATAQPVLEKTKVNPNQLAQTTILDPLKINLVEHVEQPKNMTQPSSTSGPVIITGNNSSR